MSEVLDKVKKRVDAACDQSDVSGIDVAIRDGDDDGSFYEGEESKTESKRVIGMEVEDKESI